MRNRSLVPRPWWEVGLTVLPGLILLLGSLLGRVSLSSPLNTGLRFLAWAVMLLLILSSVLWAAARKSLFQVPVWGLIPLGLLVGFLAAWGLISTTGTLDFYGVCFLLLFATGLVFARRNGLSAGLFVLAGGIVTTSWHVEPTMYLSEGPFREMLVGVGMIALFFILTPILVLRSRSLLGQAVGLLSPMAAYAAAFAFGLSGVSGLAHPWFQFTISKSVSVARPYIALFATAAIAAAVYAWISSRDYAAGEPQRHGAA